MCVRTCGLFYTPFDENGPTFPFRMFQYVRSLKTFSFVDNDEPMSFRYSVNFELKF